ncbi:hypothetical protein CEXT_308311 [Caerostris extrusa]|uniref:Uncharacterized protein n=1 Tax=Caerostris extrusa TaxID=172846 RepID=A0AAV4TBU8_CAEEX|nr:hypothetical protein CEXT_308311 [Caerostris extrusa]
MTRISSSSPTQMNGTDSVHESILPMTNGKTNDVKGSLNQCEVTLTVILTSKSGKDRISLVPHVYGSSGAQCFSVDCVGFVTLQGKEHWLINMRERKCVFLFGMPGQRPNNAVSWSLCRVHVKEISVCSTAFACILLMR